MRSSVHAALFVGALLATAAAAADCPDAGFVVEGAAPLTAANWTERVGFAPDLGGATWAPGTVVDVASKGAVEAWLTPGVTELVAKWGLTMPTAAYRPIHPSCGYIDATNRFLGQAQAVETPRKDYRSKGIRNYTAGLPFPQPKTGLEVAWNLFHAYQGDDSAMRFGVLWISAKRGVWKSEDWEWLALNRATHRTDLDPKPDLPLFARMGVQYASLATTLAPYDKAGTMALYHRFETPRDQQGWAYAAGMRRTIKLSFGIPGTTWNNADLLWEDVRGYSGFPEWMTWTLVGRRTVLAPMHAASPLGPDARRAAFDLETAPHWNPRATWEPRAVYVIEGVPKMSSGMSPHPYGKVVLYVDAETFLVPIKEVHDRAGNLWRVLINAFNESPDMDRLPPVSALSLAVDLRAGHATAFPTYESRTNLGLDPERFTEARLRTLGQ